MTRAEAIPVLESLNVAFKGAEYKGDKILGFIIARNGEGQPIIDQIATYYLNGQDYQGFLSSWRDFLIHVILENELQGEPPITKLWQMV